MSLMFFKSSFVENNICEDFMALSEIDSIMV